MMKKIFFVFLLMVTSVITANAQSLTGKKWFTYLSDAEDEVLIISFYEDGGCMPVIGQEGGMKQEDMSILFHFTLAIPGSYKVDNNHLLCDFDYDGAVVEIEYDISGVDESTKPLIESMLKPEIEKMKPEAKQELWLLMPKMDAMNIVSLTDDTLILVDKDGTKWTFNVVPEE